MHNDVLPIDLIALLKKWGYTKLEDIPPILKENPNFYEDFPEASKWLEEYYHRMQITIHKEFVE
jgi:hypothetical protein